MYLKNKFTNRSIIILQNPFKNILTFKGYYYKRLHRHWLLKNRLNNNHKSRYHIDKNQYSLYKSKQYYLNILKKNKILFYYINEQLDLKIRSKTSTGIIKMYTVLLRILKRVLKFLLSKLTLHRMLIIFTITLLLILITYKNELNRKFERYVIEIVIHKVLKNKQVIDKISYEIMLLTKQEKTKTLMRDLILKDILPNKEMKEDFYKIIKREIIAYLKSNDCRKELKTIIINDVFRNEEIRKELFNLIREFITLKQVNSLEDKLEKILIDILANEGIHSHISNKMEVEINKMLRDESIIKMMIEILKGTQ